MRAVYYAGMSLDGLIADKDGGTTWMHPFFVPELGFHAFFEKVGAVVLGRTTYELAKRAPSWPYKGRTALVVTSRPLADPPPDTTAAGASDLRARIGGLRAQDRGDIWIIGGGKTARACLDAGLVDELELYLVPRLLGQGIPLLAPGPAVATRLLETRSFTNGIVLVRHAVER
jgi:dihydrofolate reductase